MNACYRRHPKQGAFRAPPPQEVKPTIEPVNRIMVQRVNANKDAAWTQYAPDFCIHQVRLPVTQASRNGNHIKGVGFERQGFHVRNTDFHPRAPDRWAESPKNQEPVRFRMRCFPQPVKTAHVPHIAGILFFCRCSSNKTLSWLRRFSLQLGERND